MKTEQEYIKDLTEIRSMMERSTKFLSLSGMSGVMAGVYALVGAFLVRQSFYARYTGTILDYSAVSREDITGNTDLFVITLSMLVLAIGTAIFLAHRKSGRNGEKLWNAAAKRLVINMAIPLVTGGIFILILFAKGMLVLIAPATLLFYGLALINASRFTYDDLRYLGFIQIVLGLIAAYFVEHALLLWAIGFGIMHIVYGIIMHLKYEK
ncbi:hypothetical protein DSL64_03100 [Dyadobacter luteus]|uniref:Uncharacterized protein n=1 Tax=Dyadobacter luteus TaxID=2259619 RepID=A0A3D8YIJ6_9BACT|nr:hypothetical protein [Dyadobacter luteus]REA63450.1 hypothetical protein DSL64_03100 [Dyadobacter luteus]